MPWLKKILFKSDVWAPYGPKTFALSPPFCPQMSTLSSGAQGEQALLVERLLWSPLSPTASLSSGALLKSHRFQGFLTNLTHSEVKAWNLTSPILSPLQTLSSWRVLDKGPGFFLNASKDSKLTTAQVQGQAFLITRMFCYWGRI